MSNTKKLAIIMSLGLVSIFSLVLSFNISNVLFVERIGAEKLPQMFIINSVVALIISLGISNYLKRIEILKIYKLTILVSIFLLGGIFSLVKADLQISYYLLYIFIICYFLLTNTIYIWQLIYKIFTPFEAKKNIGFYGFACSLGGILSGGLTYFLGSSISTENFILFILASFVAKLIILSFVKKEKKSVVQIESKDSKEEKTKASVLKDLLEGLKDFKSFKLAKEILIAILLYTLVKNFVEYQFQVILSENLAESKYNQIVGLASIIENVLLTIIFLTVQRWIFTKYGMMTGFRLLPELILIPLILLLFFPIVSIAILLKVMFSILKNSIHNPATNLIFTGLPEKKRSTISGFVNSISENLGGIVSGAVLSAVSFLPNNVINIITITFTGLLLILTFKIKNTFQNQISKNINGNFEPDIANAIENFSEKAFQKAATPELVKVVNKNISLDITRKGILTLGKINAVSVIPSILSLFEKADVRIKYAIIEMMNSYKDLESKLKHKQFTKIKIKKVYSKIITDKIDPHLKKLVIENIQSLNISEIFDSLASELKEKAQNQSENFQSEIEIIQTLKNYHDRGIIEYLEKYLDSENLKVQSNSIIALWQFQEMRIKILPIFIKILGQKDYKNIKASLDMIYELKMNWESHYVKEQLHHENKFIRAFAAQTLLLLGNDSEIKTVVNFLCSNEEKAVSMARKLRHLENKTKLKILKKVQEKPEEKVKNFIQNLKKTNYNFDSEIKYIESGEIGYL